MDTFTRVVPVRDLALRCLGIPYKLGAKAWDPTQIPDELDCSGFAHLLVAGRVQISGYPYLLGAGLTEIIGPDGSRVPISQFHGSWKQGQLARHISVPAALAHIGCFLFKSPGNNAHGHVAMSLGEGHTIEATGGIGRRVTIRRPSEQQAVGWDFGGKFDQIFTPAVVLP